jgi:hypothetical protein
MKIEIGNIRPWKPLLKLKPWTIALIILALIDSIVTVYIGDESSVLILWVMTTFDLTLAQAMIARIFYLAPFIYLLDKQTDLSNLMFVLYIAIYLAFVGVQWL